MENNTKQTQPFEFISQGNGRNLLIAVLKRDRNAFKGTRFQFVRNNPSIRLALDKR